MSREKKVVVRLCHTWRISHLLLCTVCVDFIYQELAGQMAKNTVAHNTNPSCPSSGDQTSELLFQRLGPQASPGLVAASLRLRLRPHGAPPLRLRLLLGLLQAPLSLVVGPSCSRMSSSQDLSLSYVCKDSFSKEAEVHRLSG